MPPAALSWYGAVGTTVALGEKLLKLINDFASIEGNVQSLKLKVKDDIDLINQFTTIIQEFKSDELTTFENDVLTELTSYLPLLTQKCDTKIKEIYSRNEGKTKLDLYWSRLAIAVVEETEKDLAVWVGRLHVRFSLLSDKARLDTIRKMPRLDPSLQFQYNMQSLSSDIQELHTQGQTVNHESLWLTGPQAVVFDTESPRRRAFGTLDQRKVMVEFITTNAAASVASARDAVGELAFILSRSDPTVFHVPKCIHMYPWQQGDGRSTTYGMIFDVPEAVTTMKSLSEIILDARETQNITAQNMAAHPQPTDVAFMHKLSSRHRAAHQLAMSLRYLHSFGYVHQSIRTSNIIVGFFVDRIDVYLCGFERSRPNVAASNQRRLDTDWRNNIYRSPERVATTDEETIKRHTMSHDIYSLGVVLLELGLFAPLVAMESLFKGKSASNVRDSLQSLARQQLPAKMGDTYTQVVLYCLDSAPSSWVAAHLAQLGFVEKVIAPLQRLSGTPW